MLEVELLAAPRASDSTETLFPLAEQRASLATLARVPEPRPMLLVAIGLGGFATARAVRARRESP
jgi:hypothetical protein